MRKTLIGEQFTRLTVLSYAGTDKYGKSVWLCRCICGVEKVVSGNSLKRGLTKSCGCLRRQLLVERNTTHGHGGTPERMAWVNAEHRCTNPNHKQYSDYGGRGIKFLLPDFEEFLAHIGPRPSEKHTLDRIDNSGHYEIGNIRWATQKTQHRNKRSNRLLTYQNKTLCVAEWAEKLGISHAAISGRLELGWSVEKALGTPVRSKRQRKLLKALAPLTSMEIV